MTTVYDQSKGREEHILLLPDDRKLAYAHNGPSDSRTVVLFFTGLMSVGTAGDVPEPCRKLGVHWISPTLPGMGNSTIRESGIRYHVALARDISALLSYLYPSNDFDKLYLAGGSYGTGPAQMLYGAPYEIFPAGRKILGCMLIAGFSPFRYDTGYAKKLSWQNWLSIGPPTQFVPFHLLQRLFKSAIGSKLQDVEGAKKFLDQALIAKMDAEENSALNRWLERKGKSKEEWIEEMAKGTVRCCANWDGFMEVSDVIHSDWGFDPRELDEEHAAKPILVISSEKDDIGGSTNDWLVANYKSARLKVVPGGHISAMFWMDEIWEDMINK